MEKYRCTLAEMLRDNLLESFFGTPLKYKGFTVGKRGKQLFWYVIKSKYHGKYAIYPQYENGKVGYPRYVNPDTTIVTMQPLDNE